MLLDLGAVAVPVLDLGRLLPGGDVEVGDDEGVAVDGVGLGELVERGALVGVQGAPSAGPRIRGRLPGPGFGRDVEADPADQQPGAGGPPVRAVVGDGDLSAGHVDRVGPVGLGQPVEQPPQRRDPPRPDRELDLGEQRGAGQLSGEVASIRAQPDPPASCRGRQRGQRAPQARAARARPRRGAGPRCRPAGPRPAPWRCRPT